MKNLYLDIETATGDLSQIPPEPGVKTGNLKDPAKIEAKKAAAKDKYLVKAPLTPRLGRVIAVGTKLEDEEGAYVIIDTDEVALLRKLADRMYPALEAKNATNRYTRIVTFNGQGFDIPFLLGRYLWHGIPFPRMDIIHAKPWDMRRHVDMAVCLDRVKTTDLWTGACSLDGWCDYFNITAGDDPITGAEVPELWDYYTVKNDCEIDNEAFSKIIRHCEIDILKTEALYNRVADWLVPPENQG